jgi:hypothetical protein
VSVGPACASEGNGDAVAASEINHRSAPKTTAPPSTVNRRLM